MKQFDAKKHCCNIFIFRKRLTILQGVVIFLLFFSAGANARTHTDVAGPGVVTSVNAPSCQAGFTDSTSDLVAYFTNTSTGTDINTEYKWNFGDNNSSSIAHNINPTHRYQTPGIYTVCLTIKNKALNCFDSVCHEVTITQCQASFDTSVTNNKLTLTNTSTGVDNNTYYRWSFGDGGTSRDANATHAYLTSGKYNVCLTILNDATGCSSTNCDSVTISPFVSTCTAAFTTADTGLAAYFTNTSTGTNGGTIYTWNFGDNNSGSIAHDMNPTHLYVNAGTYTVCLTIQNSATGCFDSLCKSVTVSACQASFDTSVNDRTVTFTSTSTGADAATHYTWNFGDGSPVSHAVNPVHIYPQTAVPICYTAITLSNSSNAATTTGFQQQVIVNSSQFAAKELAGLQNVEFTTGPAGTGTALNAWLESGDSSSSTNTVWWVNLGTIVVPALGNTTIYMNFMSVSVMSASGVTGEAPQLSTTYGQYDNGSLVFPFYDNFAGTSLSGNWTSYSLGSGTLTVNNGLTITSEYTDTQAANVISSVNSFPANVVAETYAGNCNSPVGATRSYMPGLISESAAAEGVIITDQNWPSPPNDSYLCYSNGRAFGQYTWLQGTPTSPSPYADYNEGNPPNPPTGYNVFSLYYTGSANSLYVDYSDVADGNSQWSPTGNLYFALGIAEYGASSPSTFSSYWARTRQYPPGGVMPGASAASLSCQAAGGKYDVCLTILNGRTGCSSTSCDTVTIAPFISTCTAAFTSADTGLAAYFTNTSTGINGNTIYTWNFGDNNSGSIAHNMNPTHLYDKAGTYTVCLVIQNSATSCFDSICQQVTVTQCQASYDTSVNGSTVTFTSTSTGTDDSTHYIWNFGDGSPVSHVENPVHTFTQKAASICYTAIVLSNSTNTATTTGFQQQVVVNSSQFAANELPGLQNVEFTTGPSGTGTVLNAWLESGDSNTSVNTTWWVNLGSVVVPANGNYTIYMNFMPSYVMSASGVTGEAPELSTTYGQYDNGKSVFPFYDNFAGTSLSNNWTGYNSGSGTVAVNNGLTITSEYTDDTAANVITSVNSFPANVIAETDASGSYAIGGTRSYMPGLIGATAAAEGVYVGDAYFSTNGGANPTPYVSFTNGRSSLGTYAFLEGSPTSGYPYSDYDDFNDYGYSPGYAVWSLVYTASTNSLYQNYADQVDGNSSFSPSGSVYFALGIGEYGASSASTFSSYWARTRQYPPSGVMPGANAGSLTCGSSATGKYDVCLTIINGRTGCNSASCDTITIAPFISSCTAAFTYADTALVADFTNTSTGTDNNTEYTWNFGDNNSGSIAHDANPTHRYASAGTYTVCLAISNKATGCYDSTCQTVTITQCQASFDTSVSSYTLTLTNTSTGVDTNTSYRWSYGDGDIGHDANETHSYAAPGKYDVCLTIDNSATGCSSTVCDTVTIVPFVTTCTASFTSTDTDLVAYFTNTSTGTDNNTKYSWHFGDGGVSNIANPKHLYDTAGTYTVCLTIENFATNCFDSVCHSVTVTQCQASFDTSTNGNALTVTSTSTGVDTNTTYTWTFGDGATNHDKTFTHNYAKAGRYDVCLTINNSATGCSSISCDSVTIRAAVSGCDASFTSASAGLIAAFTNTSTGTSASTVYGWNFGDGTVAHDKNPQHEYKNYGTYYVCLTIEDTSGSYCFSTFCDSITLTPQVSECTADFTWTNVKGQGIHFYSDSKDTTKNTKYSWNLGDGTVLQNEVDPAHRYKNGGTYYVCLTITDSTETYCNSTFCDSVNFVATGIDQLSLSGISLYYDPSASQVVVSWIGNDNIDMTLVNVIGQTVQTIYDGDISTGNYRFNVNTSSLTTGIYLIHVTSQKGNRTWKIFVMPQH